jgi:hypothetical protein
MKGIDKMRKPTLHLNGTGKEMLCKGYEEAYTALCNTEKALCKIEFNPRDYYVQGSGAWDEAVKEMDTRLAAIGKVKTEIEEILESLDL